MAEYIKREAVYTAFANAGTDVLERASELIYIAGFSYEYVIEILDDIPAADVAPVIRCKDCKHRTQSGHCKMCRHSDGSMRYALDDEFCSMGTKMKGADINATD